MDYLTPKARRIFDGISRDRIFSNFTFVGGSAISYYLKHRLSEDLDFFSWESKLPPETDSWLRTKAKDTKIEIANQSESYLDIFLDDIKITLFANDWEILKERRDKLQDSVSIAALDLLTAMKINALSHRAKFRDYYDLYVLNKEKYSLKDMFDFAVQYIPGITLKIFCMQLTYVDDIDDEKIEHLSPKFNLTLKEIQTHFENGVRKLI